MQNTSTSTCWERSGRIRPHHLTYWQPTNPETIHLRQDERLEHPAGSSSSRSSESRWYRQLTWDSLGSFWGQLGSSSAYTPPLLTVERHRKIERSSQCESHTTAVEIHPPSRCCPTMSAYIRLDSLSHPSGALSLIIPSSSSLFLSRFIIFLLWWLSQIVCSQWTFTITTTTYNYVWS